MGRDVIKRIAIKRFTRSITLIALFGLGLSHAASADTSGDYLVKVSPNKTLNFMTSLTRALPTHSKVEDLGIGGWVHVQTPPSQFHTMSFNALSKMPGVVEVQPNYRIKLLDQPGTAELRATISQLGAAALDEARAEDSANNTVPTKDNPDIPAPVANPGSGNDPLYTNQWGMIDIGAQQAWNKAKGGKKVVVAILDTGIDYLHEDLQANLWRNPGESGTDANGQDKSKNGIDDDGNGFVDDVIGWDFASNDNKPYDLAASGLDVVLGGGNPGHGTHCAGNVGARGSNGIGISGADPNVSIMVLRFLNEKGQGTTAGAIQAINYALKNGANITSNSWGSEGEEDSPVDNKALRDALRASQEKGVLFVAAAGNGHSGIGYNNDTDSKPGYPASYDDDIIVSVAALDSNGQLGSFSNWGPKSVDIGAPGVKIYSTTVGNHYSDVVAEFFGQVVNWDGTSMATPHVAGAAALYLSQNPSATWQQIKAALINSATPVSSMTGKSVSGGKLNLDHLLSL